MIEIIPSISVLGGKVAKLSAATTDNARWYERSPLELAQYFESNGFRRVHLVDLDGAREGQVINYQTLQLLRGYTDLKINFSGGIRTDGGAQLAFENGADTVTAATIAATDPERFTGWLISFGRNKMVLGADVMNGTIADRGRRHNTGLDPLDHISYFAERGVLNVKLTDVARDGELEGPNFELIKRVTDTFPSLNIMVSGGVRSVADIEALDKAGVSSVIIARAFYEDRLPIGDLAKFVKPAGAEV
ncbi:MAG: HisA/HisF-related TIM barrel protein [Bacteroidota bacterium]